MSMSEKDRHLTEFSTPMDLHHFNVTSFGMCNATFERLIEKVINGIQWGKCLCYLDDNCLQQNF